MASSIEEGPIPCQAGEEWCELCKLKPWPGLCHQPGPLDISPEEATEYLKNGTTSKGTA